MDMDREEQLHQEDLQRLRGLRLIDDDFMNACFDGNIEGTELLLRIILDKPDISVKKVKTQKVMKNLLGRDIWLDIDADDSEGKEYDIEVQRADKVRYFKEDEKGVAAMCKVMEDMRNDERIDGAKRLLEIGKLSIEEIASAMRLSVERVKELASQKMPQ